MHTVTEPLEFLDYGIKHRASDWHLCAGDEPSIRVNGDFQSCGSKEPITEELLRRLIIGAPNALQSIDLNHRDETFCYGTNTFRLTSFFSCGKLAATIRHIPQAVVPLQTLGVPQKFYDFLKLRSGLILISGPTGSGKSTTLTASLDHINSHESGMVLTLEDPIEFFHQPRKCIFRQRELRHDFPSFPIALKAAMRQDPDYIVVAEMRDYDTISAALTAAETGHLVFSTVHSATAHDAVTRILDAVPDSDKSQQRALLGQSLVGILAQQLVPTLEGPRTGCFELLVNTTAIRSLIRNANFGNILSDMSTSSKDGMVTMDTSLERLVSNGVIASEVAIRAATHPDILSKKLNTRLVRRA